MTERLAHLIYTSSAREAFSAEKLIDLLNKARENNQLIDVTGILLYSEGDFFQILEGNNTIIENLYRKIENDNRHSNITKIISESIAQRDFTEWTMGFVNLDPDLTKNAAGINDFFSAGNCLANMTPGRAKKILQAFAQGHWRQSIT